MNAESTTSPWWGWGAGREAPHPPKALSELLDSRFGELEGPAPEVEPDAIELPPPQPIPSLVSASLPDGSLGTGTAERITHAVGMSYPDIIRLRSGGVGETAPDAVAYPRSRAEVEALIGSASRAGVAVVPFGGGTSVVGGVTPDRAAFPGPIITVDTSALKSVELDERSRIATLGPGLRGPEAEAALQRRGFTLGHFPQSFERATIGGFTATRSAGQASTGYGRFDSLVTSIRMATPIGVFETIDSPHSAAGPALREIAVGSEGALGVIVSTGCAVALSPTTRAYGAWMLEDFDAGTEACRMLVQSGCEPGVMRLSDREETEIGLALSSTPNSLRKGLDSYLALRGRSEGCLLICCWEGVDSDEVKNAFARAGRLIRKQGGVTLGPAPTKSWERGRFNGPYLRDRLIEQGVMVDTVETANTWSALDGTYRSVGEAIRRELGERGACMCHLSHAYRDGASLYFTFFAPVSPGEEIACWQRVKRAACSAMSQAGATITHHHAVGRDHRPWLGNELSRPGVATLKAIKEEVDPAGVLNPGVLVDSEPRN